MSQSQMQAIEIDGRRIATDNEGFLLDPGEWDRRVAEALAARERLTLGEDHWTVVDFVRRYYEERHAVPEARHALRELRARLGRDKASRKYLYSLFPYGYGQQACKIAGMRKPLKLMLDV